MCVGGGVYEGVCVCVWCMLCWLEIINVDPGGSSHHNAELYFPCSSFFPQVYPAVLYSLQ